MIFQTFYPLGNQKNVIKHLLQISNLINRINLLNSINLIQIRLIL